MLQGFGPTYTGWETVRLTVKTLNDSWRVVYLWYYV